MSKILGISAFYHDSAAVFLEDGKILAAAQEERFSRIKHDSSYPRRAVDYCLKEAGCAPENVDAVVFYEKPFLKFERLIETYLSYAPCGYGSFRMALPLWLRKKLFQKKDILNKLNRYSAGFDSDKLYFSEHHYSHAASAYYPSPFSEAVVLTMDGVGEWATTSVAVGRGESLEIKKELHFPHSLGLLYSAFTYYLGFKVNSGEYKVMGLAPYGEPKYEELILKEMIDLKEDGSFRLNMKYFAYPTHLKMIHSCFEKLFGRPARVPEKEPITEFHMDVAASIQAVCERVVLKLARALKEEYQIPYLCLAGGVALNCVANGKIRQEKIFKDIWIQPAAGDAGGALGAALALHFREFNGKRITAASRGDQMNGAYLGPSFEQKEIEESLNACGAKFKTLEKERMIAETAEALSKGLAVGWFQGRMEFGPRALGARSILADPRRKDMQKQLNLKIKFRESFRPFAPAVLREDVGEWFEMDEDSPYMLQVAEVNKKHHVTNRTLKKGFDRLDDERSSIPAVTHVDFSARIQTVHHETNPLFHQLISQFKELTGCGVLVNTSFNVRGEPIVNTPEEAFRCFMGTDLDLLVCGQSVLYKKDQECGVREDYKSLYTLD